MSRPPHWLHALTTSAAAGVAGLIALAGDAWRGAAPGEFEVLERARSYGADFVFFRQPVGGRRPVAEALVYVDDVLTDDEFAERHRRLWNWGAVPLVYRKRAGRVDLLRCAHAPDFARDGVLRYRAFDTLDLLTDIDRATDVAPWWDSEFLRSGSLWDDPQVCAQLFSADESAHRGLILAIEKLDLDLQKRRNLLPELLRRRLLVLSLLIAYLEDRTILQSSTFARHKPGARRFFEVLGDGQALVALLAELELRFNGEVFCLEDGDREALLASRQLGRFASLVEGRTALTGQMELWRLYSFSDLPVELISHVYELFVPDRSAVYTPPFLVRMLVEEALGAAQLDRLAARDEAILDPSCGSGVFLVEAYKRLISHWRSQNDWRSPDIATLRALILRVRGIDTNHYAVELAAFSLCLAMCEALDAGTIQRSTKLFPKLRQRSLHVGCFFDARTTPIAKDIGVILGNPPFQSEFGTPGAVDSSRVFAAEHGKLPDKQLAFLFLHDCLQLLQTGGILCLLQPYSLFYNEGTVGLRRALLERWDIREVIDLVSIRGLFGKADTKVVALVAMAQPPSPERPILHAVFRRTGAVSARRGFDIDYYDLHWMPRAIVLEDGGAWRANLFGGGRVRDLVDRLRRMRTLGAYIHDQRDAGWDEGTGFIAGKRGLGEAEEHIVGKPCLPSEALTDEGINEDAIFTMDERPIERPRTRAQFTAPTLLIRRHFDLQNAFRRNGYLTYKDKVFGIWAPRKDSRKLAQVHRWLNAERRTLKAYTLATSLAALTQKATLITAVDVRALPYPASGDLEITPNERIIADDIVDHYNDFVRLGEDSPMLAERADAGLASFRDVFVRQVNKVYGDMRACKDYRWTGVVCQPFAFGGGEVDWSGVDELRTRLVRLLAQRQGSGLTLHRICRVFDGRYIFLLKPDRLRYWIRSIALRDADETLADLRAQGY